MFRPLLDILRRNTQLFWEATSPITDPLIFVLLDLTYCIWLSNIAVVYLICFCELSKLGQVTSLLNVKT
jgi:hypothetical protein